MGAFSLERFPNLAIELPFWVWLSENIRKKEFTILLWCPLLVIETYVQAHPDFLGMFFLAGSEIRLSLRILLSKISYKKSKIFSNKFNISYKVLCYSEIYVDILIS
ncbi:hypothetical protein LFX25_11230 [Leptospira sp. FAT2]|uniref:hypothetical protein n=1 Tax=Leptospira sanjuanensis TaxID=2879643 RepID=UPI001EE88BBE|nr:hypothetical protein [Leptospira sanjuanensis]MCG6193817.1 hypothetical protein [Leptospira sanjuanensis]